MDCYGKLVSYDFENQRLTFDLSFVDENSIKALLQYQETDGSKSVKLSIGKSRRKQDVLSSSRKRWFGMLSRILEVNDVPLNSENMEMLHESMKETYSDMGIFEKKVMHLGTTEKEYCSLTTQTEDQLKRAFDQLIVDYPEVDFNRV